MDFTDWGEWDWDPDFPIEEERDEFTTNRPDPEDWPNDAFEGGY